MGNLRDWWTSADTAACKARADRVAERYGAITPVPGHAINGRLTLGDVHSPERHRVLTPMANAPAFAQAFGCKADDAMVAPDPLRVWHLVHLESIARAGKAHGGAIHDARIAAICLSHGVAELWSADRDISRSPTLAVRTPLIATSPQRSTPAAAPASLRSARAGGRA
ncbi:MAG: hypothetical protein JNL30_06860 [Rubrivivax sp.]|nr:hypothetical protein [Rubrivivax sp.]